MTSCEAGPLRNHSCKKRGENAGSVLEASRNTQIIRFGGSESYSRGEFQEKLCCTGGMHGLSVPSLHSLPTCIACARPSSPIDLHADLRLRFCASSKHPSRDAIFFGTKMPSITKSRFSNGVLDEANLRLRKKSLLLKASRSLKTFLD